MGGHGSHPLGWAALALVVVAYAHVIFELALAALALAIAARVMTGAPWRSVVGWMTSRPDGRLRRRRDRTDRLRAAAGAQANSGEVDRSAAQE